MDTDQWIKVAPIISTAIFGASTVWLSIKQHFDGNKNARREEYKFAKAFFEDLKNNADMHPFARKKGFQAIGRVGDLPPSVVEHLMSFHDPVTALGDYEASRTYLQNSEELGLRRLSFENFWLWRSETRRKILSRVYLIVAIVFYFVAFGPWLLFTVRQISAQVAIYATVVLFPIGIAVTVIAVREFIQLRRAMRLIRAQNLKADEQEHAEYAIQVSNGRRGLDSCLDTLMEES